MEDRLIERCKAGDIRAFEDLYRKYGRRLYGLCLRMSGSREDAEELMQDVFVVLLGKIGSFRGDAKFSTWLYRIAVNVCISRLRKRRSDQVSIDDEEGGPLEIPAPSSPVIQRALLKRAIANLPAGYRAVVIMHDIQGFNHKEIAGIMGISVGASKSQLFKARRRLRRMIEQPGKKLGVKA
jgi:RNA polymerase sigma-70 factor (ECF subfamily)